MKAKTILKDATLTYFGENKKFKGHTINADIELGFNEDNFYEYWICSLTKDVQFEKSTLVGHDYDSTEDGITSRTFDFVFTNIEEWDTGIKNKCVVVMVFKHKRRQYLLDLPEHFTRSESEFQKLIFKKTELKKAA